MAKKLNTINVAYSKETFSKTVARVSYIAFGKNPEAYRFSVVKNDSFEIAPTLKKDKITDMIAEKIMQVASFDPKEVALHIYETER